MPTTATIFPSSSANWTNSTNANATDGVFATAFAARAAPSYSSVPTPNLLCQTFTNLGSGVGAGDTVTGITVKIKVKQSSTDTCVGHLYLARGGILIGAVKSISPTTTLAEFTLGGAGDTFSGTWHGADLANLQVVFYALMTTGSPGATISVDSVTVSAIYTPSTADAFTFTDVTGATQSTLYTSDQVSVSGLSGETCVVSVSGGEYEKNNDGVWLSADGTAVDGDLFRVRITSSALALTAVTSTLTIGGTSDTYSVTTVAADTTPTAFGWTSLASAEPNTVTPASSTVTVAGINSPAAITISGASGQYSKNGGSWTNGAGTVVVGDVISVRLTTSASFLTGATTTVTIGGVNGTFTATTRDSDTTPDQFTWADVSSGAATSTVYTSNTITIAGLEAAAALTFATSGGSSHEYNKNGGGWTAVGATTITNGQTLQVRMTSPAGANLVGNIAVTIGGISDTYSVSTGADITPTPYLFSDITDGIPGVLYTHTPITLAGLGAAAVTATCTASNEGAFQLNGAGGWLNTVDVVNGDTLTVRARCHPIPGIVVITSVTVGDYNNDWRIYTRSAPMMRDF